MFGYVKPVKTELLVREYEFYRATYCGICRAMKKHTGTLSNVSLSYDSVFLALVRMLYIDKSTISADTRRCIAHPLTKKVMLNENPALEYTARAFALFTYYKLADDISDEGVVKRMAASVLRPIASVARSKAECPSLEEIMAKKLGEISALERAECASVDEPASLFGELLGEVFAHGLADSERLVPYECGYHLGKFIYAADAAEDYDEDLRSGRYNPYVKLYGGAPLTAENRATVKCALLLECNKLASAVNLLPFGELATVENIVNNIIYLGLKKRIEFLDKTEEKIKETEI